MAYHPPSLLFLLNFSEELKQGYPVGHAQRLSFIALYDQVVSDFKNHEFSSQENVQKILMGALLFPLTDIKELEYKGRSPSKRERWLWVSGSELYTTIKSNLGITKNNRLDYSEKLMYLNEFYKYIRTRDEKYFLNLRNNIFLKNSTHLIWKNKKSLQKNIKSVILVVLNKKSPDLDMLIHSVPILDALVKNIRLLDKKYESKSINPDNIKRREMLCFLDLIICSQYHMDITNHTFWHVCVGAILFVAMDISKEYNYLSSHRSALFFLCLQILNIQSLDDIKNEDKIICLRALFTYILAIKENSINYNCLLENVSGYDIDWFSHNAEMEKNKIYIDATNDVLRYFVIKPNNEEVTDALGGELNLKIKKYYNLDKIKTFLPDILEMTAAKGHTYKMSKIKNFTTDDLDEIINKMQSQINKYLNELEQEKQPKSYKKIVMSKIASHLFQQTVTPVIMPLIGINMGSLLTKGALGLITQGTIGSVLITGINYLVKNGTFNSVSAKLCGWLLARIGTTVGDAAASIMAYPFSATAKGFAEMRSKLASSDDIIFVNMVNTILNLDSDIISEDDKNHLRHVFGLEKDEFLEPLNQNIDVKVSPLFSKSIIVDDYQSKVYQSI